MSSVKELIKSKTAILWDFDGTLFDSESFYHTIFVEAFRHAEITISNSFFYENISFRGVKAFEVLCQQGKEHLYPLVQEQIDRGIAHLKESTRIPVFQHVSSILRQVNDLKKRQVVVSNSQDDFIENALNDSNLRSSFEFIVGRSPSRKSKPAPDPYLEAIKLLGLSPQDCLALEDSETGIKSALAAGLDVFLIDTPSNHGLLTTLPVKARVTHSELFECVKSIF